MNSTGSLVATLLLAVPLTALAAWIVAGMYRRRMLALMGLSPAPRHETLAQARMPLLPETRADQGLVDYAGNRRAGWRLLLALSGLCLLVALSQSWLALHYVYETDRDFSARQWLTLGLIYAWPMALAWGLQRRWSWLRTAAVVLAYFLAITPLVMLASNAAQSLGGVLSLYALRAATPMAVVLFIGASGRIRAVAPYLLPVFVLLVLAAQFGLDLLAAPVAGELQNWPGWLRALVHAIGANATFALFALAPWLLAAWPVYALGRGLAAAYRNKRYSDLGYLFAAYWLLILFLGALPDLASVGAAGLISLAAWLWLPLGIFLLRGWLAPGERPPTLLVLRVFQRDAAVEDLFDRVIERWRLSGNTLLIAGTDLVSRTLDPDDLFTFLNGKLAERFIASPEEIPRSLAGLDLLPDPDGRYRVNEWYCFDGTWQTALGALVSRADLVLMDLRGFKPENLGCRFELGVLATAAHLQRLVFLHDGGPALALAREALGNVASAVIWLEAPRLDGSMAERVLRALLGDPPSDAPSPRARPRPAA